MSHESYSEQLSAMLDGELPPAEMAQLTLHIAACPECGKRLAELAALRAALQYEFPEDDVSPEFYTKIAGLLDTEIQPTKPPNVISFQPRPVRQRLAWLTAGAAIAAMLTMLLLPHHDESKDLMSVRDAALRGSVLSTVAMTNAAPVAAGFRLTAARSDIVAGHPAQVLTYSKNNQTIILCVWSANGEPAHGVRNTVYQGMAISYWNDGKQEYWAATAGADGALDDFVKAIKSS